jgi:hypothetical protein
MGMKQYQKSTITPKYATEKQMKIFAAGNVETKQVKAASNKPIKK